MRCANCGEQPGGYVGAACYWCRGALERDPRYAADPSPGMLSAMLHELRRLGARGAMHRPSGLLLTVESPVQPATHCMRCGREPPALLFVAGAWSCPECAERAARSSPDVRDAVIDARVVDG